MKRPASQFYWGDWLSCTELRVVSLAARGLWMDMLCHMRDGRPVGHLTFADGRPISADQIAGMVGKASPREVRRLLAELEAAGVPGKSETGAYFSRRMVREEEAYENYRAGQSAAGRRGAGSRWGNPSQPHAVPNAPSRSEPIGIVSGGNSSSSSSSSSVPPSAVARAPIIDQREHRKHAHCGRVCLPAALFGEFERRRNHDNANRELRDWAMEVEREWGPGGSKSGLEPGDVYDFWKARYAERWPAATAIADRRTPSWATR